MSTEKRAWLAWGAVCLLWGTGFLAMKIGVESMPPLLFSGLRILFAGVLMAIGLRIYGHSLPRASDLPPMILIGIMTEGIANGVLSYASTTIPSGVIALLIAMSPFWMVCIEAALPGGDRLHLRTVAGLVVGFAGLFVLVRPAMSVESFSKSQLPTYLIIQGVCVVVAFGSIYSRRVKTTGSPLMGAAFYMIFAGVGLTVLGLVLGEWSHFRLSLSGVGAFLYLMLFGSMIGYSSYIYALRHLPVSVVSSHRYVNTAVAVTLGAVLLGERFGPAEVIAILLIFVGVLITQPGRVLGARVVKSE